MRESWLGRLTRASRKLRHEILSWITSEPIALPTVANLTASITLLHSGGSNSAAITDEQEAPIFLLSTGWRAGSTLLQRILVTDPQLFLWGEPLGEMTPVSRITEMISSSVSDVNLELWRKQEDPNSLTLATSWVANLYPPGDDFRLAIRGFLYKWLAQPARRRGFKRWGFKEVRLGSADAVLLHWLFPNAKFVVISRHPFDSYRSLADSHWAVYYRYPVAPIDSAAAFARLWNRFALSWSELPADFPCVHLKYEDLISGKVDFRKLEYWLGLEIKENVALSAPVGGTAKRNRLTWYERMIIARLAEAGMHALGYSK